MNGIGIIGREADKVTTLLRYIAADNGGSVEVRCLPMIATEAIAPVVLPVALASPELCLVFTSPRSVTHYTSLYKSFPHHVVSIGQSTTQALTAAGAQVSFTATQEDSESFARELYPYLQAYDRGMGLRSVLLQPTSDIAGLGLHDYFTLHGYRYYVQPLYRTIPHPSLEEAVSALEQAPEWVVFYSPSAVKAWHAIAQQQLWSNSLSTLPIVSIGPKTTAVLQTHHYCNIIEAATPHPEELWRALQAHQ